MEQRKETTSGSTNMLKMNINFGPDSRKKTTV